jgi:hypothetical protein
MDEEIGRVKQSLLLVQDVLISLYPNMVSVGSPFYIVNRTRIATKIVFADRSKKCIQVAKLLYEAHIGRRLVNDETVDHIDGNALNNSIDNLQLLSFISNAVKGPSAVNRAKVNKINRDRLLGKILPHVQGSNNAKAVLSESQVVDIKTKQLTHYRGQDKILAMEYGISREVISAIRRGKTWNHVSAITTPEELISWKTNSQFNK